jgi:four helix bundle protein
MNEKKKVSRFEDLEVWQEGCDLAVQIYKLSREGKLARDYGLRDQMTKSAVSIPSNIAEGKERETAPELIRYLYISKGSSGELQTQLYIAQRIGYVDEGTSYNLIQQTKVLSKKLGSFIQYLKRSVELVRK